MIRLLEYSVTITNYDLEKKLYRGFKDLDWDNNKEIKKAIATAKYNEDKEKIFEKKIKNWKEKRCTRSIYQKLKKNVCLETKKVDNDKKADDNKNASDNKDTSFPALVAIFFGLFTPIATSPGFLTPVATFSNLLTLSFVMSSLITATGTSIFIYPIVFLLVCFSLFFFPSTILLLPFFFKCKFLDLFYYH